VKLESLEVEQLKGNFWKRGGWSHQEDAESQRLKNTTIKFEDAALAVTLDQNAKSVALQADKLSDSDVAALLEALQRRDNDNDADAGDNWMASL